MRFRNAHFASGTRHPLFPRVLGIDFFVGVMLRVEVGVRLIRSHEFPWNLSLRQERDDDASVLNNCWPSSPQQSGSVSNTLRA